MPTDIRYEMHKKISEPKRLQCYGHPRLDVSRADVPIT